MNKPATTEAHKTASQLPSKKNTSGPARAVTTQTVNCADVILFLFNVDTLSFYN